MGVECPAFGRFAGYGGFESADLDSSTEAGATAQIFEFAGQSGVIFFARAAIRAARWAQGETQ
jgi:hypothetical protein